MTELSEREQHLADYLRLLAEADGHLKWLVAEDLKELLPEYIEAESAAAEEVQVSFEALRIPEMHLSTMGEQISDIEGRCLDFEKKLTDSSPEVRVQAAEDFRKWNNELTQLNRDRDVLETEIDPLRVAYGQARAKLAHAQLERAAVELNISDYPYWGLGHKTDSYQFWRADMGNLIPILLAGDPIHPEWEAAFAWLDRLCIKAGYRTEGRIPTNAEEAKRALENYLRANSSVQPQPTMTDVRSQEMIYAANQKPSPASRVEYVPHVNPNR